MILLLAGTEEAFGLAQVLAARGLPATASLAGVTERPRDLGLPTQVGGFGGDAGFARYLREHGVTALVDATHPFAARIGRRTKTLCDAAGVRYLRLLRPGWRAGPGDVWHWIDRPDQAADLIPAGACVLMAVGPRSLPGFGALAGRQVLSRRIDATDAPFPLAGGAWIVGRPSADAEEEAEMMRAHGVDWLVTKDSGGQAGRGKLDAARLLGLPVVIQHRPDGFPCERVETPKEALRWLEA